MSFRKVINSWATEEDLEQSLRPLMRSTPPPQRQELATYLENGELVATVLYVLLDPFKKTQVVAGAAHVLTDGRWVWPDMLSYFVRNYNLHLPPEFVAQAAASHWQIRCELTDKDEDEIRQLVKPTKR